MSVTDQLPHVDVFEDVDFETFRDQIFGRSRPVLMKEHIRHWPAVQKARESADAIGHYVSGFDNGNPTDVLIGPPEIEGKFFYSDDLKSQNFTRQKHSVSAALEKLLNGAEGTFYIQSIPVDEHLPGFERDNHLEMLDSRVKPRIWIGNQLTVQTHFDLLHNIAGVVAGRRRFTIFPPDQIGNLYMGPLERTLSGPPVSMVRLDDIDHEKYPRFQTALDHALRADLEPGDALYIPYFWWHQVQSLDPFNVLVNFWWNDAEPSLGSPYDTLLHALLSIRDLPPEQRSAWKAVFDHLVFQENGPTADHLPPEARGIQGDLSPQQRGQFWRMLIQSLISRHAPRG